MIWRAESADEAARTLRKLDKQVARRDTSALLRLAVLVQKIGHRSSVYE